jgi:hypothetical protein
MGIEKFKALEKAIKSKNIAQKYKHAKISRQTPVKIFYKLYYYYRILIVERSCRCGKI